MNKKKKNIGFLLAFTFISMLLISGFTIGVPKTIGLLTSGDYKLNLYTGLMDYYEASGTDEDAKVGIDAVATAGYLGAAYNDGVLRADLNELTYTDGGNFITFGLADHDSARTALGLSIGSNVQAYDANLTTYAGITPSANVQTLLGAATFEAFKTSLVLTIGADVQAYNANLTTYAGIAPSVNVQTLLGGATFAAFRASLGLDTGDSPTFTGMDLSGELDFNDTGTLNNIKTATFIAEVTNTASSAFTIDWRNGIKQNVTITGTTLVVTFTDPPGPCNLIFKIIQGDGSDTITWPASSIVKWASGGTKPTLSTASGAVDFITIYFDGVVYWANSGLNYQ